MYPAIGVPLADVLPEPEHTSTAEIPPLAHARRAELLAGGFPPGLITQLEASCRSFPIRFFVLDNSGSMSSRDGTRVMSASNGKHRTISVSRWEELCDCVAHVANLTRALGVRSDFQLLNRTDRALQFMTLEPPGAQSTSYIRRIGEAVDAHQLVGEVRSVFPSGGTPLTEAVERIISQIEPAARQMRACGQQAVVTLMTDGLPNDTKSFEGALRRLQKLPCWLVVRLCTDVSSIVKYWDELDKCLESSLEVLDDVAGEAGEVSSKNVWLTYGQPLHVARTFGLSHRLFDLLDEQRLLPTQAKTLCEVLLDQELPEPQLEPEAFVEAVRRAQAELAPIYDPVRKCSRPWIDVRSLARSIGPQRAFSVEQCLSGLDARALFVGVGLAAVAYWVCLV